MKSKKVNKKLYETFMSDAKLATTTMIDDLNTTEIGGGNRDWGSSNEVAVYDYRDGKNGVVIHIPSPIRNYKFSKKKGKVKRKKKGKNSDKKKSEIIENDEMPMTTAA
jgi:hypothetical protein